MDICSINTRPLSSLYYADARAHTHAHVPTPSKRAGAASGRRAERTFARGRAALTGFAGVFVVYGLRSLLLVVVVVRLLVVEAVTNCHFAPESQAGKHQRDPAHLSGQCRGHSVHLKTELERGARCSADGEMVEPVWEEEEGGGGETAAAAAPYSADHGDGSLSSLWVSGSYSASFMAGAHRPESRGGAVRFWASVSEASAERACPPPRR